MCQPIRYTYPNCGHPIVSRPDVWTLERCRRARCWNRDCWVPNDILDDLIKDEPWPNDNLTDACALCVASEEQLPLALEETSMKLDMDKTDAGDLETKAEVPVMSPVQPTVHPENQDKSDDLDKEVNVEDGYGSEGSASMDLGSNSSSDGE
ncbi:hypothetical protein FZEAL_1037 [Fusarium zealandicum]|uniref:Uncharacterized protein n=1 Tax=Fusarium zealandicum TaxID=1053134 RepID=A0A8H4XQB5_9HYPO|nr:hypothetical protein FZEAL_1037 [Fusarium zealandicum]